MNQLPSFEIDNSSDSVEQISQLFDYINEQLGVPADSPLEPPVMDALIDHLANEDYGLLVVMEQNGRY